MSDNTLTNGVDGGHLMALIERIEKLSEEKAVITNDIKDVFVESKSSGYDPRIIRKIVAARKKAKDARDEENELLALYAAAIKQPDLFGG